MTTARRFVNLGLPCLLLAIAGAAQATFFQQTNLVSSVPGNAAFTDPNLKNPWGVSHSDTSPFWVSNQVTATSTLYNGAGHPFPLPPLSPLVVSIPPAAGAGPTGQVFNSDTSATDFVLSNGTKASFMFANLDGTVSGWNNGLGTSAQVAATIIGGELTGLALGNNGGANFLYAADEGNNKIDVLNTAFGQATLSGTFTDPNLPTGFVPYNIMNLGGTLFVAYENETSGGGVVNAFDLNGNFLRRITSNPDGGVLASPWGMAIAPAGFGPFGGALLVGNEDNGHIAAFNPTSGAFLGTLNDASNNPITNDGTWGLIFGNGGNGGNPNTLYVAAGIEEETQGLFLALNPAPEPGSALLLLIGGLAMVATLRAGRKPAPSR